jgi:hypothetical protein
MNDAQSALFLAISLPSKDGITTLGVYVDRYGRAFG